MAEEPPPISSPPEKNHQGKNLFSGNLEMGPLCVMRPSIKLFGFGVGFACFEGEGETLNSWFLGGNFKPRSGTDIIPPSGDHHRSSWRLMMQDHFSPGSFLTGFAPFLNQSPNFPQVGTPGPSGYDPGLLLLFLDHHGEQLTPGRFPRYIPHERQAWADTLMVKYVASGGTQPGTRIREFSQSLWSQVGGFRGDGPGSTVTWMSMSNEREEGCGGDGTCIWTFDVGLDGKAGTTDDILLREVDSTVTTVTSTLRVATFFGATNGGIMDLHDVPLAPIETVPTVVDDRLDQSMSIAGNTNEGLQALRYQIQIVGGPNFHGEEGSDPYIWVICGSRTGGAGEEDCDSGTTGIIDESFHFAFISGGTYGDDTAYSHADQFGANVRFFNTDDGAGIDGKKGTADDTIVMCTGITGATIDGKGNSVWGADCDSHPGGDSVYGTSDDGLIYYREAVENGFRSGTRENRAFAFSFIDAQEDLRQILGQSIPGDFLASCLNCNNGAKEHPNFDVPGPLNYDQAFSPIPPIQMSRHPLKEK